MKLTAELIDRVIQASRLGCSVAEAPRRMPKDLTEATLADLALRHAEYLNGYDCVFESAAFNSVARAGVVAVAVAGMGLPSAFSTATRMAFVYGLAVGRHLQSCEDAEAAIRGT